MAAPNLLTKCRSCGQTIFSDAKKCQFCGPSLVVETSPRGTSSSHLSVIDETGNAELALKVCCVFWIVWNAAVLFRIIQAKLAENAGGPAVHNNVLGLPVGLITAIALTACCIGMMGKNPSSLRKGIFVSIIGSIILSTGALFGFYFCFTGQPSLFLPAVLTAVGAVATYVTRLAAKRV